MTKTLLILGMVGLVLGTAISADLIHVENSAWFVCLPAGAVFFGLFMIAKSLQSASAEFDLDQSSCLSALKRESAFQEQKLQQPSKKNAGDPVALGSIGR